MRNRCEVAELLRAAGPVRMPLRECCVAALVGARPASVCEAAHPPGDPPRAEARDAGGVAETWP
ncbi:hypothetical protein BJY16_001950 [Actinoplanes octamycinicus]|uniref:Uncharacterized protein n=1 Tax=Actinoplanes octamycinicus TaxID=135948 RepID=A0A7W7GUH8_9ACTN|nr:hypothetical protein [Actinoplanes octamycinicus]MBB4738491.1 hypothetical protein [Actinoplanes octamycinicus]GIE57612.1 hypothetical protein Aoc01nite_30140 [Actinoplanes octamycinicus]